MPGSKILCNVGRSIGSSLAASCSTGAVSPEASSGSAGPPHASHCMHAAKLHMPSKVHHGMHPSIMFRQIGEVDEIGEIEVGASAVDGMSSDLHTAHCMHGVKVHLTSRAAVCAGHHARHPSIEVGVVGVVGALTSALSDSHSTHCLHGRKVHLVSNADVCSAHHAMQPSVEMGSSSFTCFGSSSAIGELRLSASHPSHPLHPGKAHLTSIRAVCAGHHGLQLPPIESVVAGTVAGLDGRIPTAERNWASMTGSSGSPAIAGAGAVAGAVSGAVSGAVASAVSGDVSGAGAGVAAGAGSGTGAVSGAISGAISGAVSGAGSGTEETVGGEGAVESSSSAVGALGDASEVDALK